MVNNVGIMGKNITLCKLVYDVMINKPKSNNINVLNKNFTMIIPSNFGFDKVEKDIQISFEDVEADFESVFNNPTRYALA